MELFNRAIDVALLLYFAAFSWAPPAVGLTVLSAVVGVAMLWVFSKTSDQARLKKVKRRVYAALLELRIFMDEPAVTWRAQKALLGANLRYLRLGLRPTLWMIVPMALLLIHLESFYGRGPLPIGQETVVTMRMAPGWNPDSPAPDLAAPPEVSVDAPAVRAADAREVSWRIVPRREVSGALVFTVNGQPIRKLIEAGRRQRFVPGRSVNSALAGLWSPAEGRVRSNAVEWVEIRYPDAPLHVFGLRLPWLAWFFGVSIVAALLLKKRFGVVI